MVVIARALLKIVWIIIGVNLKIGVIGRFSWLGFTIKSVVILLFWWRWYLKFAHQFDLIWVEASTSVFIVWKPFVWSSSYNHSHCFVLVSQVVLLLIIWLVWQVLQAISWVRICFLLTMIFLRNFIGVWLVMKFEFVSFGDIWELRTYTFSIRMTHFCFLLGIWLANTLTPIRLEFGLCVDLV